MKTYKMIVISLLIIGIPCTLGLVLAPAQAASEALPPRPETPTPTPTSEPGSESPTKTAPEGALIVLEVDFGDDWPARGLAWQDLWAVVEWQDENSTWHVVEGWQGSIGKVAGNTGWATWWLSSDNFGQGPFRWVVYERRGSAVMATSDPFDLPGRPGEMVTVEVALAR